MVCRQSSKAFLGTSSTVWLTKDVDTTARLQLPVVTYTSPACPAPSRCVSLFVYNLSLYMPRLFLYNTNFMHPAGMLEPEETTCTARVSKSYVYGEITDHALSHKLS